jgi:hypothetical protein
LLQLRHLKKPSNSLSLRPKKPRWRQPAGFFIVLDLAPQA